MELKIDEKEVKEILLDWAKEKWGNSFNYVSIEAQYGRMSGVEFSYIEPEAPPAEKE